MFPGLDIFWYGVGMQCLRKKAEISLLLCFVQVVCDVPCTGTGALRRSPEMKWKYEDEKVRLPDATRGSCFPPQDRQLDCSYYSKHETQRMGRMPRFFYIIIFAYFPLHGRFFRS